MYYTNTWNCLFIQWPINYAQMRQMIAKNIWVRQYEKTFRQTSREYQANYLDSIDKLLSWFWAHLGSSCIYSVLNDLSALMAPLVVGCISSPTSLPFVRENVEKTDLTRPTNDSVAHTHTPESFLINPSILADIMSKCLLMLKRPPTVG